MTFDKIEEGSHVFIDANVFIYHFVGASEQCTNLLSRCGARNLRGVTSILVLIEVCHRLMMIEAVKKALVSGGNVVRKLSSRPEIARQLVTYEQDVAAILGMEVEITTATEATLMQGLRLQRRYGLLTNDSLIVATMLQSGIRLLATADRRFESVSEIETVMPSDLRAAN
jgi:predicted nucleic acid-binding protein